MERCRCTLSHVGLEQVPLRRGMVTRVMLTELRAAASGFAAAPLSEGYKFVSDFV